MANHKVIIPFIKSWEGGFSNNKNDKGGATMKGVTFATFRPFDWDNDHDGDVDVNDLKKITDAQWEKIFVSRYWNAVKGDQIKSQSIANFIVDWYWMSGNKATKKIQQLLRLEVDGVFGPKTLEAINKQDAKSFFAALMQKRRDFYTAIVQANPSQKVFLKGWLNRLYRLYFGSFQCSGSAYKTSFVEYPG